MTTLVTRKVNDSGPYAYRVEAVGTKENGNPEQEWTYLGPTGKIDPDKLTNAERAQLRDEGIGLDRFRDGQESQVYKRAIANTLREEFIERWGEDVLAPTDDKRSTTIELAEDAPRAAKRELGSTSDRMQTEIESGAGQSHLNDVEKDAIDFSRGRANTFHARASKAGMLAHVDDWTTPYREDLSVEENIATAKNAAKGGPGSAKGMHSSVRDDSEGAGEDDISLEEGYDKMEKRAVEGAGDGHSEAVDELRETFAWTDSDFESEFGEVPA